MYKIILQSDAEKYYRRLPKNIRLRIWNSLATYVQSGWNEWDVIMLVNSWGLFRMRVGDYRIIFSRNDEIYLISVIKIWPRGDVYK